MTGRAATPARHPAKTAPRPSGHPDWTEDRWEVVRDLIAAYWPAGPRLTPALRRRLEEELQPFPPQVVVDALDLLRTGEYPSIGLIRGACVELRAYAVSQR